LLAGDTEDGERKQYAHHRMEDADKAARLHGISALIG
jgi:hypothetical protein